MCTEFTEFEHEGKVLTASVHCYVTLEDPNDNLRIDPGVDSSLTSPAATLSPILDIQGLPLGHSCHIHATRGAQNKPLDQNQTL